MTSPLVSVVMPCLNAEATILRSIDSVLTQSCADIELIVVDNGSTDGTLAILESLTDPRLIYLHEPVRGVSYARNRGLQQACGRYVAFLDADDTWDRNFLAKMTAALDVNPEAILAYCGWQNLGVEGERGRPFVPPVYEGPNKMQTLLVNNRWPIHACLARLSDVRATGGFDTRLIIAEDYLLWLELAVRGRLLRVPEVLAYYHHHEGQQATKDKALTVLHLMQAKLTFLSRHPQVVQALGLRETYKLTWGLLIEQAKAFGQEARTAKPLKARLLSLLGKRARRCMDRPL
ncbi:MAG: glycosyltransferase [Burkholderiales bacterium]|nr:glycosyltransferase [Burkholderiales bacterium]